ncbi:MBL fold metallo-hydrolase [Cellulosimicrobium sp. E-16]|uniref:MBL fold metallo-hydrolase n=1 Tax=Cellulosimicrobium sp. E-16 TaxID=3404049 RepID=UPI003CE8E39A
MTTTPSPEPLAPDAAASLEEWWICRTCAVEHAERPGVCAICADERQWVPASGQAWTTLAELAAAGERLVLEELEPDLFGLTSEPSVGIGQQAKIVRTPAGNLLWDPPGYVDDDAVARVRALGPVVAIAASHPHMFGVQVAWSRALGGVPVLVAEADAHWVARPDPVIETWTGEREVLPGVVLSQPGGHFPGSAVVHWAAGAEGRGVLLSGDTIFANPDRTSVSFMRSYPNRIPLSAAVVLRVAERVARRPFERLYNNFEGVIPADARGVVLRSAERHAAWVRGDFDHLT